MEDEKQNNYITLTRIDIVKLINIAKEYEKLLDNINSIDYLDEEFIKDVNERKERIREVYHLF